MNERQIPGAGSTVPATAILVVITAVIGCSLYANLSVLVTNPADYRFFPPFERWNNRNDNHHLGAEYYSIAGALIHGRGYADPFQEETGPTAWMPPVLSWVLAGLRWAARDEKEVVVALFVLLQDLTLIGTGVLLLALARRTAGHVGIATLMFVLAIVYYFRLSFQHTHDCWIVLAAFDVVIAGLVWLRPLRSSWKMAIAWGVVGGLCALTSPVVGFVWGIIALVGGGRRGARGRFCVATLAAVLTVTPWVVRNYVVFGRFIPVKSNLAYELYQSQCLQRDGVLHGFPGHPYGSNGPERRAYKQLGEMAYLDRKWDLFREAFNADPLNFCKRVTDRLLAATLVYTPFDAAEKTRHPWQFWLYRITYPLPFLCLLLLLATTPWRPLAPEQWIVIGAYLLYLFPYVIISYYDRYKFPVLGAEAALVVWGGARVRQLAGRRSADDDATWVTVDVPDVPAQVNGQHVTFACSGCAQNFKTRTRLAGKKIKCRRCGTVIRVPNISAPVTGGVS